MPPNARLWGGRASPTSQQPNLSDVGDTVSVTSGPVNADPDGIYLADSFVLGIETTPSRVSFELEAVLERDHPAFYWPRSQTNSPPTPGSAGACRETSPGTGPLLENPTQDQRSTPDYGNIDAASIDGNVITLSGDWGAVTIQCRADHGAPRFLTGPRRQVSAAADDPRSAAVRAGSAQDPAA